MKRTVALFLALATALALTLCACGGDGTTATLVSTDWVAVLDYGDIYSNRQLSFQKDGTGTLLSDSGMGGDITWDAKDDIIEIELRMTVDGDNVIDKYTFTLEEVNGSYRLVEDNEADNDPGYLIFVPKDRYESETEAIKAERLEAARGLPMSALTSNEAEFKANYVGKLWKVTGKVWNLSSNICCIKLPVFGEFWVYMSTNDLARIKEGSTVTVVGIPISSRYIVDAFII